MKKGDDFFRITFNRENEEIQRFEKNMDEYTAKYHISRPFVIAAICNYFIENDVKLRLEAGKYIVDSEERKAIVYDSTENVSKQQASQFNEKDKENAAIVATTESNITDISSDDSDEMLRAMGLI